jgi:hypothetical protein
LRSHAAPRSTVPRQPGFAIPARRPRRATSQAGALSAKLRQPEPSQYWQLWFFPVVYPGNREPGHASRSSPDPSKPAADLGRGRGRFPGEPGSEEAHQTEQIPDRTFLSAPRRPRFRKDRSQGWCSRGRPHRHTER